MSCFYLLYPIYAEKKRTGRQLKCATSASLLTGLTYYLIANPDKMKKLTSEIRGRFSSSADLTFEALAGLSYLNACKLLVYLTYLLT